MGYEGQLTILRDFVHPPCQKPKKQAILRIETPPGKQAQMRLAYVGREVLSQ